MADASKIAERPLIVLIYKIILAASRYSAMYNERQQHILREITRGLGLTEPGLGAVAVEQSPGYIDSVIETARPWLR
jgi:hypothetical protein